MKINVLLAEDDEVFRMLVSDILLKKGYRVLEAKDGKEAMDIFFSNEEISLCILDIMMPIYSGLEVLSEIREYSDVPVLMLTALGDEKHEIDGLLKGANDYISKPFSYPIFTARVEALLRVEKKKKSTKFFVGEIYIDLELHKIVIENDEITLNNKEYSLLIFFINNIDIVLCREQILRNVWGYNFEGDIRTIDSHIKMLRSKMKLCGRYIKTVRGVGYVFEVNYEEEY